MGDVFAKEERDVTICAMDVFFYGSNPKQWGDVSL